MLQVNMAQFGACETVLLSGPCVIKLQNNMAESQVDQKSVRVEGNDSKRCAPKIPLIGSNGKKFKNKWQTAKFISGKQKSDDHNFSGKQ